MTGNSGAARVFQQVVRRKHTPFAGTGSGLSYANCPECHVAGVVLDSRGERAVRYPVCQRDSERGLMLMVNPDGSWFQGICPS